MKLKAIRLFVVILIILMAISLILPKKYFWNPVKGAFAFIFSPVQKVVYRSGSSAYDFFATIGTISELAKENESLKDEVDKLMSENAKLAEAFVQ